MLFVHTAACFFLILPSDCFSFAIPVCSSLSIAQLLATPFGAFQSLNFLVQFQFQFLFCLMFSSLNSQFSLKLSAASQSDGPRLARARCALRSRLSSLPIVDGLRGPNKCFWFFYSFPERVTDMCFVLRTVAGGRWRVRLLKRGDGQSQWSHR